MKHRYAVAIALVAIAATACSKNAELKPEQVFATVNGETISVKEFENYVGQLTHGGTADKLPPEQRTQVVDMLIKMHAAAAEATKAGLDKTYDTVSTLAMIKANVLTQALVKQYMDKLTVSDADVQAEYDTRVASMPPPATEYKASHILLKTKEEADAVMAQLQKGGNFAELAKKHSTDPGSGKNGGDLGWFQASTMVKEFSEAVAKLGKGETTKEPVKSQFGFHIIKLEDTRQQTQSAPKLTDEGVKTQIENLVKQKKVEEYLDGLRKAAKVEMNTATSSSSSSSSTSSASSTSSK